MDLVDITTSPLIPLNLFINMLILGYIRVIKGSKGPGGLEIVPRRVERPALALGARNRERKKCQNKGRCG